MPIFFFRISENDVTKYICTIDRYEHLGVSYISILRKVLFASREQRIARIPLRSIAHGAMSALDT